MYLKRKAYDALRDWKRKSGHSTLEVSGARQSGKTYLVNRFADEQYKRKIYINLLDFSGELFLEQYTELRQEMMSGIKYQNPMYELIRRYRPDFADSEDTVVIIDEIQESADIYNRVREFTRELKSDFIITGSYLGRILKKEFKYSSGDLEHLEIHTLDFEEFLTALGKQDLLGNMSLYGESREEIYEKLSGLYSDYCQIGGYPGVVLKYVEKASMEDCQAELLKIIRLFTNESRRYFEDILEDAAYDHLFLCVARVLAREKKEFTEAIDWLYSAGIIGFAGKVTECSILNFKAKARCYFMDVGLASYFLRKAGCSKAETMGIVNENFVYLDLKRRTVHPAEIALETPAFATLGNGEIDFYVRTLDSEKIWAVEVKSGKNAGKTAAEALKRRKIDYILYAKGDTHGGRTDSVVTIPIYGISKYHFSQDNHHLMTT